MAVKSAPSMPNATVQKAQAVVNARSKKGTARKLQYAFWIGGTVASIIGAVILMIVNPGKHASSVAVNDESVIMHVNRNAKTWSAGANEFFEGWTIDDVKALEGIGLSSKSSNIGTCKMPAHADAQLPESFDSRKKWPQCFNYPVYSMGNCTASWAITAASSLSNRFCIANPDEYPNFQLSPQHLLSCDSMQRGCRGGSIDTVWDYIQGDGLVTETCMGYQADSSISCNSKCSNERPFKAGSRCVLTNEEMIKHEVMTNGPVVALVFLTNDFLIYKGGVFKELPTSIQIADSKRSRQLHAIKIVGWGREKREKYWLIENAWGNEWGANGFGKVAIGTGSTGSHERGSILIDTFVIAGTPFSEKLGGNDEPSLFADENLEDLDLDDDP